MAANDMYKPTNHRSLGRAVWRSLNFPRQLQAPQAFKSLCWPVALTEMHMLARKESHCPAIQWKLLLLNAVLNSGGRTRRNACHNPKSGRLPSATMLPSISRIIFMSLLHRNLACVFTCRTMKPAARHSQTQKTGQCHDGLEGHSLIRGRQTNARGTPLAALAPLTPRFVFVCRHSTGTHSKCRRILAAVNRNICCDVSDGRSRQRDTVEHMKTASRSSAKLHTPCHTNV